MKCPDCGHENIPGADDCSTCNASLIHAGALAPKRGMEKRILEGFILDLAPKKAVQVLPSETLLKAVESMRKAKIGCVLAVEGNTCLGLLSERELIQKVPETADLSKTTVSEVMRRDSTSLKCDDPIADVFHHMAVSGYLHVPVSLKDGGYGIVSARDLLHYLCK